MKTKEDIRAEFCREQWVTKGVYVIHAYEGAHLDREEYGDEYIEWLEDQLVNLNK